MPEVSNVVPVINHELNNSTTLCIVAQCMVMFGLHLMISYNAISEGSSYMRPANFLCEVVVYMLQGS
jgi:hypothetical protein